MELVSSFVAASSPPSATTYVSRPASSYFATPIKTKSANAINIWWSQSTIIINPDTASHYCKTTKRTETTTKTMYRVIRSVLEQDIGKRRRLATRIDI